MIRLLPALALALSAASAVSAAPPLTPYDIVIRNSFIYDGSGAPPYAADVAVTGDRIAAIAPHIPTPGRTEIDAHGKAVAPGFVNMLAHPEESLIVDGRGLSDLAQGVTLEAPGEDSMGPLTLAMKALALQRQSDIKYGVTWTTLGQYLDGLEKKGISPNVASFVGEGTVAPTC
jgi:N-acyl-D-amino-acid deacylase